jgi:hypothetical protein
MQTIIIRYRFCTKVVRWKLCENNIFKINIIYSTRKTNSIHFNYFARNPWSHEQTVKDLQDGVSELCFLHLVDNLYTHVLKLLGPIRLNTYNFSFIDSLKILHIFLKLLKLEYAPIAWNKLTLVHSDKLENIQKSLVIYVIGLFSPSIFAIVNQCWIIYILRRLIPGSRMLTLYFLLKL